MATKATLAILLAVLVAGCESEATQKQHETWNKIWEGAVIIKICRSGDYVYRRQDGQYWTGGWRPQRVEDPNTVCE